MKNESFSFTLLEEGSGDHCVQLSNQARFFSREFQQVG